MTLNQVLDCAAGMEPTKRWNLFSGCGPHDRHALARSFTDVLADAPYFWPVCCTVFSAGGFQMWSQPKQPYTSA
jgi:hypothetical protein